MKTFQARQGKTIGTEELFKIMGKAEIATLQPICNFVLGTMKDPNWTQMCEGMKFCSLMM
jgi:hypothetical protein